MDADNLVGVQFLLSRVEVKSKKDIDPFVGIARDRYDFSKLMPSSGGVANFFDEFPLCTWRMISRSAIVPLERATFSFTNLKTLPRWRVFFSTTFIAMGISAPICSNPR